MITKHPRPLKKWGQHFLHDQKIIAAITQNFLKQAKAIVEIGPGPGALTVHLKKHELPFLAIDIDERAKDIHKDLLADHELIIGDALDIDLNSKLNEAFPNNEHIWLVGNLPYNVSTALLVKFLTLGQIPFMTLMFQKEVGEKILLKEGEKYLACSLGLLTFAFFETSKLCNVKPGAFFPPPKVDSVVLSFQRRSTPLVKIDTFAQYEKFLRKIFSRPRKQVKTFWRHEFPLHAFPFLDLGLREDLRAEKLEQQQVLDIFHYTQRPPSAP